MTVSGFLGTTDNVICMVGRGSVDVSKHSGVPGFLEAFLAGVAAEATIQTKSKVLVNLIGALGRQ